ncbi:hypothetical protein QFC20_003313 [Naganishia adeliensis]|uniref:Uncharacterized protein n=1 Tax=Naganishia adeliensis TaxID=92952 RepID=A0ACC2WD51_9TREE|nr:hypothetical protein QFC20_003313 [Naganishia adeliensis]
MPVSDPDPLSTEVLLQQLDEVFKEIPNIVQYLSSAVGTLKDLDPARKDVWARNLTGLGGQYYGRLDRVQLTLRKVVRALRERGSSPYAIRPPLPGQPLPKAFEPVVSPASNMLPPSDTSAGGATMQTQNKSAESEGTGETEAVKNDGLSVYAQRLEAAILQELKQALLDMEHEGEQCENSQRQGDDKDKIESDDMEL